jgi:hypothetical protein
MAQGLGPVFKPHNSKKKKKKEKEMIKIKERQNKVQRMG